jgi:hypothetical protein
MWSHSVVYKSIIYQHTGMFAEVSGKSLGNLVSYLPGGKGRLAHKADNLAAICEPIVWKVWEP